MLKRSILAIFCLATLLVAQAPNGKIEFEVASIRPAPAITRESIQAGKLRIGVNVNSTQAEYLSLTLRDLIPIAFNLKPYQVSGPDWTNEQRFEVVGKLPEGAKAEQAPQMLQALLIERFKLKVHRETQERSVYALTVPKSGHKMKESPAEEAAPAAAPANAEPGAAIGPRIRVATNANGATLNGPNGTTRMTMTAGQGMRMEMSRMSMPALADTLTRMLDRPVMDMTDLTGNYQVALEISMEEMIARARAAGALGNAGIAAGGAVPPAGPAGLTPGFAPAAGLPTDAVFKAVQELGLKLESRKAPIEILVIDHVEKTPTDN